MADSTKDIIEKYSRKLESELGAEARQDYSGEYQKFRGEMVRELGRYERWANSLGNFLKIKVAEKDRLKIQADLDAAHVDVNAGQAVTLSIVTMLGMFFATLLIATAIFLIRFPEGLASMTSNDVSNLLLFVFLGIIASVFGFYYVFTMPRRLANSWRLQASAQMVPAILYVVVYMKHTSNLERAIAFASQHLEGPLALDFRKIFYDVEIGKFSTIKQSLDNYLDEWKGYAPEFVEAFHLIESSLYEPGDGRRVETLEKSLQVILDGVYEKMLKYSREIRSPLTNLYMLGIILPTLGLAMLPLASTLLGGTIRWPHVFIFFNVIIPFFVFYMVSEVLAKRPGGYGETSVLELNPDYANFKSRKPWIKASLIASPVFLLGILPLLFSPGLASSLGLPVDFTFQDFGINFLAGTKFFDFVLNPNGEITGPFGPVAVLFSLFVPLSVAIFLGASYAGKTKGLIKSREDTKKLESEFANSLFQLGNRLGDGIPAEMAFGRVAQSTQGQKSSDFFQLVQQNVEQGGMSLDSAIFDTRRGAITYYPSGLISTSMKILVESVKKGLKIAAKSLMSISDYVKNIEKINYRLRDLLAEIVSDMKSNMTFLAPVLAGIVVGLSAMITFILGKIALLQAGIGADQALEGFGSLGSIFAIFDRSQMIPPYFLQISIGLYIIEVIFILTGALVTVDAGKDELREKYELARNIRSGMLLYLLTSLVSILALSVLASISLGGLAG